MVESEMRISVIVPIYSVEKYIEHCAVSLFEQTYENIEYVFVDDCSPDRSMEILRGVMERYPQRKQQVEIVTFPENSGSGYARKVGLEKATGEYVSFVDSDDFVDEKMVERFSAKAQATDADVIDANYAFYAGGKIGETVQHATCSQETYLKKLLLQNTVSHQIWARLIRRQFLIDRQIGFERGINQGEDYSITPRMFLFARWATIDDVVYFYRTDRVGTFTNHTSRKNVVSYLKANGKVVSYFKENDPSGTYLFPLEIGILNAFYLGGQAGISYAEMSELCQYAPQNRIFKVIHHGIRKGLPPIVTRFVFLVLKRCYRTLLIHRKF